MNMKDIIKKLELAETQLTGEPSEENAAEALLLIKDAMQVLRQTDVSGALLSDVDYWKQRCLLAEKCLEESPCDPDITAGQIKAWNDYHKFIGLAGNDR